MNRHICLLSLIVFLIIGFYGCSSSRTTPPIDLFKEYGNGEEIASTSLYMDQAYQMLDEFSISNNYLAMGKEIVVVYLIKSQADDKYYEIYYPINDEYFIIVRETIIPNFSLIEDEINDYIQLHSDKCLEIFDYYSNMFLFPSSFSGSIDANINNLESLDSPIILEVGKITLSSSYPSICLAKYVDGRYALFYYDIDSKEIVVISEFEVS